MSAMCIVSAAVCSMKLGHAVIECVCTVYCCTQTNLIDLFLVIRVKQQGACNHTPFHSRPKMLLLCVHAPCNLPLNLMTEGQFNSVVHALQSWCVSSSSDSVAERKAHVRKAEASILSCSIPVSLHQYACLTQCSTRRRRQIWQQTCLEQNLNTHFSSSVYLPHHDTSKLIKRNRCWS